MKHALVVVVAAMLPACAYRPPGFELPGAGTSTGSTSTSTSTSSSTSSTSSSSGGAAPTYDPASCAGNAILEISNPGIEPANPPADGGPAVGMASRTDGGTLVVIGAGTHPLQAACDAVAGNSCGQCTWFSLWIPPGIQPGTYDMEDAGFIPSIGDLHGSVTITELEPALKGSLELHETPDCGVCDEQVAATFDIPLSCAPSACSYPPPIPTCGTDWIGSVPSGPGGPGSPTQVMLAPLQGPSSPDALIVDDLQSTAVDAFLPLADGGFGAGVQTLLVPLGPGVGVSGWNGGLAIGDFNEDGLADVVDATWQGLGVMLGRGDGSFSLPTFFGVADGGDSGEPGGPLVADFDGDGHLDVAVGAELGMQVVIFRGLGDGQLRFWQTIEVPGGVAPLQAQALVTADFNGDGNLDLVASTSLSPKQLVFIPGAGQSGFGAAVTLPGTYGTSLSIGPQTLAAAQLRPGTGLWDLVEVNDGVGAELPVSGAGFGLEVLLGNGDGTFQDPVLYSDPTNYAAVGAVAVTDVDHDGNPDLVAIFDSASSYGSVFSIWRGSGVGTFTEWDSGLEATPESGYATETSLVGQSDSTGTRFALGQPYLSEVRVWSVPTTCISSP